MFSLVSDWRLILDNARDIVLMQCWLLATSVLVLS